MDAFGDRFPKTALVIEEGIGRGLHTGAQVYVSVGSVPVASAGIGLVRAGVGMTEDTILLWLSAGKPVMGVAIGRLWEAGGLDIDDVVAKFIPEFAAGGKEGITLRHLLTHTGGIRWADYQPTQAWDEIIARISGTALEPRWVVGRTAGYHAMTSWYILGEIVRRVDPLHRAYETFVREEIFVPLGMKDSWFALSGEKYREYGDRIGLLTATAGTQARTVVFDAQERSEFCCPGASGRGPARELGQFYEMLLNRGRVSASATAGFAKIISAQTVEALTARHRTGLFDLSFKHNVDWGLGFIVNSAMYGEASVPYGFGKYASARTFGHGGSQSSTAFADPERKLVVAVIFNGMPGELAHQERMRGTLGAIYEDLGFTD